VLYYVQDYTNENNAYAEILVQKLRCNAKHNLHLLKSTVKRTEHCSIQVKLMI